MPQIIGAINMSLDGIFDHDAMHPDGEVHKHYADLLTHADVILYGRKTYELMRFWQTLLKDPSGDKSLDDFAIAIDKIQKVVFSNTLKSPEWDSAEITKRSLEAEVMHLKETRKHNTKPIFVGSRSLIIQLLQLQLLDEFQICIHPLIVGSGSYLFEDMKQRTNLQLAKTKSFKSGAVVHYYRPIR